MSENNTQKIVDSVFEKMEKTMTYLYARWQDEKKYEDFKEYVKHAEKKLKEIEPSATFVYLTDDPFEMCYVCDGYSLVIEVSETDNEDSLLYGQKVA